MENYNFDSAVNQRIKGEFVRREVMACISDMEEHLFSWDGDKYASYDELSNFYQKVCPECEHICEFEEAENDDGDTIYICKNCGHEITDDEYEECDTQAAEVYEWWIVSPWFGEKLRDRGEVILERWGGWIWGRQCSGQAIQLDSVISKICYDMEILEGQTNDWNKQGVA